MSGEGGNQNRGIGALIKSLRRGHTSSQRFLEKSKKTWFKDDVEN